MKRFTLLLAAVVVATSLSAQIGSWRTINVSTCVVSTQATFTKGIQYNRHLFLGYGTGVDYTTVFNLNLNNIQTGKSESISVGGLALPIFVDAKLRLFDDWLSPSVRLRTGALINTHMPGVGLFATPEVGLDISRYFTLSVGWNGHLLYTPSYGWYHLTAYPMLGASIRF